MRRVPFPSVLLILGAIWFAGCNDAPKDQPKTKATPSALETAINQERDGESDDTSERRLLVRQKVTEYGKVAFPSDKIVGISTTPYQGNIYLIGLDLSSEKGKRTIDLIARIYVADSGETYWKVERATTRRVELITGRPRNNSDDEDQQPEEYQRPDDDYDPY